jgi:DNA-binding IclR family transcriptional regulator
MNTTGRPAKSRVQVLERMFALMEALAEHARPASLKELAAETRLHPSTAHRILTVMVGHRLVDRIEPGTYRLGIRLLELGHMVKARLSVRQEALVHMEKLHKRVHESVNLSVRQGDEIVYIERVLGGRSMMRIVHLVGDRAPLHITAVGKVFLVEEGMEGVKDYARRTGLPQRTRNTLTSVQKLQQELERVRRHGYAFDNEETELGVRCIGAGIRDDDGRLVAGISVSAPATRLDRSWAPLVKEAADEISRALGYQSRLFRDGEIVDSE